MTAKMFNLLVFRLLLREPVEQLIL